MARLIYSVLGVEGMNKATWLFIIIPCLARAAVELAFLVEDGQLLIGRAIISTLWWSTEIVLLYAAVKTIIYYEFSGKTFAYFIFFSLAMVFCFGIVKELALRFLVLFPIHYTFNIFPEKIFSWNITLLSFLKSRLFDMVWMIIYSSVIYIKKTNEKKLNNIKLRAVIKDTQLNNLSGQLNPHFIFNALNNIKSLILMDLNKSVEVVNALEKIIKKSLRNISPEKTKIDDELDFVNNYVLLSSIHFGKRLNYKQYIDESSRRYLVPTMLVQLLIENSIKHGISHEKSGGNVVLSIKKKNQNIHIKVSNTGQIKERKCDHDSAKIGIKNIISRLNLQYGERANFNFFEKNNQVHSCVLIPAETSTNYNPC